MVCFLWRTLCGTFSVAHSLWFRKRKVINFVDGLKRKLGKYGAFGKLYTASKLCTAGKLDKIGAFDIPWKKTYIPEWLRGRDLFASTRTICRRKSERKTKLK